MDLRPRERVVNVFTGFSRAETEKMESLLNDKGDLVLSKEFCQKLARGFTRSSGRAGKPAVKCIEVQRWFQIKKEEYLLRITSSPHASDTFSGHDRSEMPKGEKTTRFSELEFEAKSAKDGAWYDVSVFLSHRILPSGDAEAHVRYVGFGAEEDEWVNIRDAVRVRSVPLEPDECRKVNVGDVILCFQERRDQAIYFDARVLEIERRLHDVRGCRCLFLIQYNHDNSEEKVGLRRLCYRPTYFSEQW